MTFYQSFELIAILFRVERSVEHNINVSFLQEVSQGLQKDCICFVLICIVLVNIVIGAADAVFGCDDFVI